MLRNLSESRCLTVTYEIYSGDTLVNTIVADADFVSAYCEANGYTYSERAENPAPVPDPTTDELLNILLGVGT